MKHFLYSFFCYALFFFFTADSFSQTIKITAQVRPRFEYRHGFGTLFPDNARAAAWVSQRTRFTGYYSDKSFKAYVSLQNVRVWGDVKTMNISDRNGLMIHEAWGQMMFSDIVSLKLGRQEIIYDDHRIFGNVDWAQQARSHDAAMLKITPNQNHFIDVTLAYNATSESHFRERYDLKNYKAFQVVYYHGKFGKSGLSLLFLNNGLAYDADPDTTAYDERVSYSQTIGGRYTLNGNKVKINFATYYQGGKNSVNNSLAAYYLGGDLALHLVNNFSFGFGFEVLSGTNSRDKGVSGKKDRSFSPFFGTNHKFNGLMDYFYVGNHGGNVGLIDLFVPLKLRIKKAVLSFTPHIFKSAATISTPTLNGWIDYDNNLGSELDFTISWPVVENVKLAAGYSQMFASSSMQALKYPDNPSGEFNKNTNNWAWVMITFNPTLYSKEPTK